MPVSPSLPLTPACESESPASESEPSLIDVDSVHDVPSKYPMFLGSIWSVFAEVGGHWQSVGEAAGAALIVPSIRRTGVLEMAAFCTRPAVEVKLLHLV